MANNVGFKLGLQSALDALTTYTPGAFYLTSDTNRLYFGKDAATLVAVNEGVITVADVNALPTGDDRIPGAFYYATASNILCVYNGQTWVQINSVVKTTGLTTNVGAGTNANEYAIGTTLTQSDNDSKTTAYTIKTIDGLTLSGEGTVLTIAGDPITVDVTAGTNVATATFVSKSEATNGSIAVAGGDNVTVAVDEETNKITISAVDTHLDTINIVNRTDNGFNVYGAVNGGGNTTMTSFQPSVAVKSGEDVSATSVNFINGVATLPVYTVSEVDAIKTALEGKLDSELKSFNAMEYKGTVGSAGTFTALPTSEVQAGNAYLISGTLTHEGTTYSAGTLAVAIGEEGDDGFLTVIDWDFISGSNTDTTYSAAVQTDGALRFAADNAPNTTVASVNVKSGNDDIVVTTSATSGNTQVYNVAHKAYEGEAFGDTDDTAPTAMAAKAEAYEIEAITGVTVENGHITGVTSKTYKVLDTNMRISEHKAAVSATGNVATVSHTISAVDGAGAGAVVSPASFAISSSTLNVGANAANTGVVLDLVWGEF